MKTRAIGTITAGLLQGIIGILAIVTLFAHMDIPRMMSFIAEIQLVNIIWVFLCCALSLGIQSMLWRYLVLTYSSNVQEQRFFSSFFAGLSLRMIVPGGHLEVGKTFLLEGRKTEKIFPFMVERFSSTLTKIILLAIAIPSFFPQQKFACVAVMIIVIAVVTVVPKLQIIKALHLPSTNNYGVLGKAVGCFLLIFILVVIQYYVLLCGKIPLLVMAKYTVFMYCAGGLPLGLFLGLGLRGAVSIYFLSLQGIPAEQAVATSFFLFAINCILPAVFGAFVLCLNPINIGRVQSDILSIFQQMTRATGLVRKV